MADVKRTVRALGQKITGLKAGDNVTLVLQKPKPKVDATAAKKAVDLARDNIFSSLNAIKLLTQARMAAYSGNGSGAANMLKEAQTVFDSVVDAVPRVQDWVKFAEEDAGSAVSEVKDGYSTAKDGASCAADQLSKVKDAFEQALHAVGAQIEEATNRG